MLLSASSVGHGEGSGPTTFARQASASKHGFLFGLNERNFQILCLDSGSGETAPLT